MAFKRIIAGATILPGATTSESVTTLVDSAVADLVDAAPAVLDTLNELAAALGDDANFATTVANSLATKASTTYVDSAVATKASTSYVDNAVSSIDLSTKQDVVTGVSSTEIGYLDGVTSAIQTQLNAKLESSDLTGYATETYVNTAVSNLVDSAPSTLDTLNELAAALGDDPNYATTITTALGNKQDKVSGVSSTEIGYLDGVTSAIQTQLDGKAAASHSHNGSAITYTIEDKSANYTIVATDEGKVIRSTGSAITVTVADVFAIGEVVTFTQYGAGQITFTPAGGVTLHSVDSKRKTNKQYSTVQIMKTAAATYLLFGDIAA